jgi:hypothetical protein
MKIRLSRSAVSARLRQRWGTAGEVTVGTDLR